MPVFKVNVDEKVSVYQQTRWFVEAESEQEALDKVVHWIKSDMSNPGEDLVDIETIDTYYETMEHEEWLLEGIECEGLRGEYE